MTRLVHCVYDVIWNNTWYVYVLMYVCMYLQKQGKVPPPRVLVVSAGCTQYLGLVALDTLKNIRGYQNSLLNDYHMG